MEIATAQRPTISESTDNRLRRVAALLGAVYDDLAQAATEDPELPLLAELALGVEDIQQRIRMARRPKS